MKIWLALLFALLSCAGAAFAQSYEHPDRYQIVNTYPHDAGAFTQGLVYSGGHLYESTGRKGRSSVRMVDLTSGNVLQKFDLPNELFGEGLTDWNGNLVQVTWTSGKGFVYDTFTLSQRQTFTYKGEGWGLAHDEKSLILSDGTAYLRFLDPLTFRERRRLKVTDGAKAIVNLNELEFIHGEIYANIWETDRIVRISPVTGKVLGWIDLSGLMDKRELADSDAVLNGIAYDAAGDRLFVTGKLWPKLFEIRVVHAK